MGCIQNSLEGLDTEVKQKKASRLRIFLRGRQLSVFSVSEGPPELSVKALQLIADSGGLPSFLIPFEMLKLNLP
jgi:hypothetical protein